MDLAGGSWIWKVGSAALLIAALVAYGWRATKEARLEDWIVWVMATAMTYGRLDGGSGSGGEESAPIFLWIACLYCLRAFGTEATALLKSAPLAAWFTAASVATAAAFGTVDMPWAGFVEASPLALAWGSLAGTVTWLTYWAKIRARGLSSRRAAPYGKEAERALLDLSPWFVRRFDLDRLGPDPSS